MKKIFESELNGWYESATKVHVFALESDDEYDEIDEMTHEEKCDYFGVYDEAGYGVAPGAMYTTYEFNVTYNHVIMYERVSLNV